METQKIKIGQGGISDYVILSFVQQNKPTEGEFIKFINQNFSKLVPRLYHSRYINYMKLMVKHGLIEMKLGHFSITEKGLSESGYILENCPDIEQSIKEIGFKTELN